MLNLGIVREIYNIRLAIIAFDININMMMYITKKSQNKKNLCVPIGVGCEGVLEWIKNLN